MARPLEEAAAALEALTLEFPWWQGLTLVHFPAQLEPCLIHKNT